ncbi:MAG: radical SAM protein [bacterium]
MDLFTAETKCLLVQPKFSCHSFWNYTDVCKIAGAKYPAPPLGLLTVAALLPGHCTFKLIDENVQDLRQEHLAWADVVMTGGMLPQQDAILRIIARARGLGKPVAVGGPDPTSQPEVYKEAEYLVLGEGEVTIPLFLADLKRGVERRVYESDEKADMTRAVIPRFDLIKFSHYMHVGIQFSRGCPFNCEFCDVIELLGRKPRVKTCEQVLAELQYLHDLGYRGHVDFVDDNLIGNRKNVLNVLKATRDWQEERRYPFYFSTEASLNLARDEKLLKLMQANDFRYVFIGIETAEKHILDKTHKHLAANVSVPEAIKTISSYGMIVNGGFIIGFDNEDEYTASNLISCIQDTGICMAMVGTLYALPNTQLTRRLKREGRLLSNGAARVDPACDIDQTSSGLNFVPSRPRLDILRDYVRVLEFIYAPKNYYARVARTGVNLRSPNKYRPSLRIKFKLLWGFVKTSSRVSVKPSVAFFYWTTFFRFLFFSPRSLVAAVSLTAMYIHFSKQSRFIIKNIKKRIADLVTVGAIPRERATYEADARKP